MDIAVCDDVPVYCGYDVCFVSGTQKLIVCDPEHLGHIYSGTDPGCCQKTRS